MMLQGSMGDPHGGKGRGDLEAHGAILIHDGHGAHRAFPIDGALTEEEKWADEHAKLHEKHKGHEAMHAEMLLILIVTLIVAQIALVQWKQRHFKSYQAATLFGMWAIPLAICFTKGWYRFLFTWALFTICSAVIWQKTTQQHISGKTPRLVYRYFLLLHNVSYALGVVGYIIMMLALMGFTLIFGFKPSDAMDFGILLLFYGLYYGVLGRDLAHICTDRMACRIGYYTSEGLPKKILEAHVCGVCGGGLDGDEDDTESEAESEKTYKLSCGHTFHEFCIRGWIVVGKLQTCPYCKEKVDLKRMFKNPWEKPHVFYGQLLDWIRYLVAWQPLIIYFVQNVTTLLGLE